RADDAHGLPQRHQEGVGPAGEGVAVQLVGVLAEIGKALSGRGHVDLGGLEDGLAVVERLELSELFGARGQKIRCARQNLPALAGLHRRPGSRLERLARGRDGAVEVRGSGFGDLGDRFAGGGVDRREAFAAGGGDEGTGEEGGGFPAPWSIVSPGGGWPGATCSPLAEGTKSPPMKRSVFRRSLPLEPGPALLL